MKTLLPGADRSDRWLPLDVVRCVAGDDTEPVEALATWLTLDSPDARDTWLVLQRGGLMPAATQAFSRAGLMSRFTARQQQALRAAYEVNALRGAMLRRLAIDVSRRLGGAGIPVLWAKGVWLAHYVYEQPALRVMHDVDIFVPSGERQHAVAVLRDAGFAPDPIVAAAGLEVFADSLLPPDDPGGDTGSLAVDVHDGLRLSPARRWPTAVLWDDAELARPGRVDVKLPRPEAGLVLAAVHALKHGLDLRHLLVAVSDAIALFRRYGDVFDLARVTSRCDDAFDAAAVYLLLSAAGDRFLPASGRELLEAAADAAERHGARGRVDRLLRTTHHVQFMRQRDFSLFAVGEGGFRLATARRLLRSSRRWRRRVTFAEARLGRRRRPTLAQLATTNWRYAWSTYLAGRLSGRLSR